MHDKTAGLTGMSVGAAAEAIHRSAYEVWLVPVIFE
jgi:hypothetical protein